MSSQILSPHLAVLEAQKQVYREDSDAVQRPPSLGLCEIFFAWESDAHWRYTNRWFFVCLWFFCCCVCYFKERRGSEIILFHTQASASSLKPWDSPLAKSQFVNWVTNRVWVALFQCSWSLPPPSCCLTVLGNLLICTSLAALGKLGATLKIPEVLKCRAWRLQFNHGAPNRSGKNKQTKQNRSKKQN